MMVRSFLRIYQLLDALFSRARAPALASALWVLVPAVLADTTVSDRPSARVAINAFMADYTRDLLDRLGSGARVEYDSTAIATNAETRGCATPLAISVHSQTQSLNRVTLLIACGSDWSVYAPVDLNVYRPVVIASKPLASGAVIAAGDVELSAIETSQLAGTYLTSLDDAVGMGVKRPINQGRPIISQQLEQPLLVRRGDAVVISADSGELAVKMTGTALTDGRRGELIRVKNQTSSRTVDARVVASGQVTVPM